MSTSDIEVRQAQQKEALKTAFVYLLVALFCVLFGAVYEKFSHAVYSYYMIYAFVFPLVGGTLVFFRIAMSNTEKFPEFYAKLPYHTGIAVLTTGSILHGILDIFGTTNRLLKTYFTLGIVLTIIGAALIFVEMKMDVKVSFKTKVGESEQ